MPTLSAPQTPTTGTASLGDVQPASSGTASFDDIQPSTGTASIDDIQSPTTGTASISDIQTADADTNARPAVATGEIKAWEPSTWDRIKLAITSGNPNYSSRTPSDPEYGKMSLISPESAMTPSEQRNHPVATGLAEVAGGLTTPESVALLAGTGGLGELPGAAAMVPRLLSAGFGAQSVYAAATKYPEIKAAISRGDTPEVERLLTHVVADLGVAALAGRHALKGEAVPASDPETRPIESTSPLGENLSHDAEPAPDVRVVDSGAAKDHLVDKDTVHKGDVQPISPQEDVEGDASASVRNSDVAELRVPTARIVNDDHVPVVSQNEMLAEQIQQMVNNSGELSKLGIDPATINTPEDVDAMLEKAADHIGSNLDPRASAVIGFEEQKQLASELGMTVEELLSRKSGQAFNAEQAVAARALLNSSGLRTLQIARSVVNDPSTAADLPKALAQHQSILNAVKGMAAESGRSLGSFNIDDLPSSKISDVMSQLTGKPLQKATELLSKLDIQNPRQVNDFIERITPSSTADKIFEFYRNALLSGPATVIRKGVSEATMMALEATKKFAAAGLSTIKGGEDQRYASESYWFAKGAIDAMRHVPDVLSGKFDLDDAPGFEDTHTRAIKGPVGDVIRFPSNVLSKQTNMMYMLSYYGELNALAARQATGEGLSGNELASRQAYLVERPTSEMSSQAHDTALHNTFQSELGKFGKKGAEWMRSDPTGIARYLLPFYKTPINLAKEASYFSPYGLLKGTLQGDLDMQARGLVGSSIAAGIAYLAANNLISGGGPINPKQRDTLESTGWQPYSIHLGGKWYSYRKAEPLGLSMALVADTVHGSRIGNSDEVTQSKADTAVRHIMNSVKDVAFLPTLSNLTEMLTNPDSRIQSAIARQVAGFVPALVKDVTQTADPTVRKPTGITQTLETRIPGLTGKVPAVIDASGSPVKRPTNELGGANPFPASSVNRDPVLNEMARLGISTATPPTSIKYRGKPTTLSASETQRLAEDEGRDMHTRLARLMSSSGWSGTPDAIKRTRITEMRREVDQNRAFRLARMRDHN
jgi:hypothetical protein